MVGALGTYKFIQKGANPIELLHTMKQKQIVPTRQFFGQELHCWGSRYIQILDGVGPVDNRPSTNKLQNFVQKK